MVTASSPWDRFPTCPRCRCRVAPVRWGQIVQTHKYPVPRTAIIRSGEHCVTWPQGLFCSYAVATVTPLACASFRTFSSCGLDSSPSWHRKCTGVRNMPKWTKSFFLQVFLAEVGAGGGGVLFHIFLLWTRHHCGRIGRCVCMCVPALCCHTETVRKIVPLTEDGKSDSQLHQLADWSLLPPNIEWKPHHF